jgi:ankyrin repeat protein
MIDIIYHINKKDWNTLLKNKKNFKKQLNDSNYLIHYIISDNDIYSFRKIIKLSNKKQITFKNKYGDTAGHIAASNGFFNLLDEIINIYPSVLNLMNNSNSTIFTILINNPNKLFEILNNHKKNILSKKIKIDLIYKNNNTLLSLLSSKCKKENDIYFKIINLLLNLNINLFNPSYFPVFNMLSSINNLIILNLVFNNINSNKNKKKLINFVDYLNFTPLIHSISNNNYKITKFLLDNNADYNYTSPIGNINVFFSAIKLANYNIINELLKYDIDFSFTNNNLNTVIHLILITKNIKINTISKILKKNKNFNLQNINGNTPTHLLFKNFNWDTFIDVLKNNKTINYFIKNKNKKTPIDYLNKTNLKKLKKIVDIKKHNTQNTSKKINSINIIKTKNAKINVFSADIYDIHIYIVYLLKKYKNLKIPYYKFKFNKKNISKFLIKNNNHLINQKMNYIIQDYLHNFIHFYHSDILWHDKKIHYIPKYLKKAFKFSNKKNIDFIFINLGLISNNNNHANILIYDKKNNSIERFDPYGNWKINDVEDLDNILEKLFFNIINKKVKYLRPQDYLKVNSFQAISDEDNKFRKKFGDPDGFCLAWCYWYLELRLNNKNIDPKTLVEKAIKKINRTEKSFLIHIRNYANDIVKFKINELKKVGINDNDIHNEFLNNTIIDKIYDLYLNKEIIKIIK